jgi:hypothetical protein
MLNVVDINLSIKEHLMSCHVLVYRFLVCVQYLSNVNEVTFS